MNRKELDRLKKELREKESKNDNLMKAIDKLNDRMIDYEKQKSNQSEDINSKALVDNTNSKKLAKDIEMYKDRLKLMETSRNKATEEVKNLKVKEQEYKESQ